MPFNINSFRSNALVYDGARPTLFVVVMNFPTITSNGSTEANKLQFLASSTTLPGMNMGIVEIPYMGRTIKLEGNPVYDDWTFSVLNDEDFIVRKAFEAWNNGMNAIVSNRKDPAFYGLGYKSTATVYQLSKEKDTADLEDNAIAAYTFSGAFPRVITPITLNWAATNQIESFQVTLACDYWVPGADENYAQSSSYNGVAGTATDYSPVLSSDSNS